MHHVLARRRGYYLVMTIIISMYPGLQSVRSLN
jgi:hypothetical protein